MHQNRITNLYPNVLKYIMYLILVAMQHLLAQGYLLELSTSQQKDFGLDLQRQNDLLPYGFNSMGPEF
jgi:hypothetical protein